MQILMCFERFSLLSNRKSRGFSERYTVLGNQFLTTLIHQDIFILLSDKNRDCASFVIPVEAGIQFYRMVVDSHRGNNMLGDFLRIDHFWISFYCKTKNRSPLIAVIEKFRLIFRNP